MKKILACCAVIGALALTAVVVYPGDQPVLALFAGLLIGAPLGTLLALRF